MLSAVVVADEPMLAKSIQNYLPFKSFQVRLTGKRAEVIAEFRKTPFPDLVLLDVMPAYADGFDILLKLRHHPTLKNAPVIMLTGKTTCEAVIKGLAGGADGYITKPFEANALMRAVRQSSGCQKSSLHQSCLKTRRSTRMPSSEMHCKASQWKLPKKRSAHR